MPANMGRDLGHLHLVDFVVLPADMPKYFSQCSATMGRPFLSKYKMPVCPSIIGSTLGVGLFSMMCQIFFNQFQHSHNNAPFSEESSDMTKKVYHIGVQFTTLTFGNSRFPMAEFTQPYSREMHTGIGAVNVGLLVLGKKSEDVIQEAVMEFVSKYGL